MTEPASAAGATRKAAVAAAFGAAASGYEAEAALQRRVAERLAERVAAQPSPQAPRILELGCGTGFLTRALARRWPRAHWLITDLSPAMVGHCRDHADFACAEARFLAMDGERPCLLPPRGEGGFDVICMSLAMQWFADPAQALAGLAGLLAPDGLLAWSTLAEGAFAEWRQAHAALGLAAGTPDYLSAAALARLWPAGGTGAVELEAIRSHHPDGLAFLRALRAIGADVPASGHQPLPAGALRRVLRHFTAPAGVTVTYNIAYGLYRRVG